MVTRPNSRHSGRQSWLSGQFRQVTPAQRNILAVTLTVIALLLLVSGRWHPKGRSLPASSGVSHIQHPSGAGHKVQFLDSHQNLKRSNLLESPSDPGRKFFKGRAVPNPVDVTTDGSTLNLTGDGFLSNVAEAQKGVLETNITNAPSGDSKPLGYYFAKDIPGHVKEKGLGIRLNSSAHIPRGGKAAMGAYFNANKEQQKPDGEHIAEASNAQEVDTSLESRHRAALDASYKQQGGTKMASDDGSYHGIGSGNIVANEGADSSIKDDHEVQKSRSSLVLAINSAEGKNTVSNSGTDDNM